MIRSPFAGINRGKKPSATSVVDHGLGEAYEVVKAVHDNMQVILAIGGLEAAIIKVAEVADSLQDYSLITHEHTEYALGNHEHPYADAFHDHDEQYQPIGSYSPAEHNHDDIYVRLDSFGLANGPILLDSTGKIPFELLPQLEYPAVSREDLGLGNVENKSSATIRSEITSNNVTEALGFEPVDPIDLASEYLAKTERGAVNGVASLDENGKIPVAQLPASEGGDVVAGEVAFVPGSGIESTTVQAAIEEVANELGAAIAAIVDTDDQTASQVGFTPTDSVQATNVQAAIVEVATEAANNLAAAIAGIDQTDDQTAAQVAFTPTGSISATNVQAAIEEVAAEAAASGAAEKYSVPFGFGPTPTADEYLLVHVFAEAVTFPANFAGAAKSLGANPAVEQVIDIRKNGATCGSITISTTGVVTFASVGSAAVSFAIGDRLTARWGATAGTTIVNSAFTLLGTKD